MTSQTASAVPFTTVSSETTAVTLDGAQVAYALPDTVPDEPAPFASVGARRLAESDVDDAPPGASGVVVTNSRTPAGILVNLDMSRVP